MKIFAADEESIDAVRALWREYWDGLQLPSGFQNFEAELDGLPGLYAGPKGFILLAAVDDHLAGAVALRPLPPDGAAEIKRLYVRPRFRGLGIGRALLAGAVQTAREIGYSTLYADTLPAMAEAQQLYYSFGFKQSVAYSQTPTPGAIFLSLKL